MISDAKIKCFLAAAHAQSFSAAAARLYISQQAVSKHIAELEDELGVRLFMRDRRHLALTTEGSKAAEWFEAQEKSFAILLEDLAHAQSSLAKSEIRIGYQNWMDFGKAPRQALKSLRAKYPGATLSAERYAPSGLIAKLSEGWLDLVLIHKRFIQGHSPELVVRELFDTPMIVVCAEDYPGADMATGSGFFDGAVMIIDRLDAESDMEAIRRARREAGTFGFSPGEVVVVPNRDSVYEEAELGRGVFLGSESTQLPQGARLLKFPTGERDTVCAIRLRANKKKRVELFMELLVAEYASDA